MVPPLGSVFVSLLRLQQAAKFIAAAMTGLLIVGCLTINANASSSLATHATSDPKTRQALLRIAVQFNNNYSANRDGLVYDRWDATSRAVISRAQYVKRHVECPTAPGHAVVEDASRAGGGYWRVRYSISGSQLTDYWHYEHGRWRFDLARSNPSSVGLYRLSFAAYAAAVGCNPSH